MARSSSSQLAKEMRISSNVFFFVVSLVSHFLSLSLVPSFSFTLSRTSIVGYRISFKPDMNEIAYDRNTFMYQYCCCNLISTNKWEIERHTNTHSTQHATHTVRLDTRDRVLACVLLLPWCLCPSEWPNKADARQLNRVTNEMRCREKVLNGTQCIFHLFRRTHMPQHVILYAVSLHALCTMHNAMHRYILHYQIDDIVWVVSALGLSEWVSKHR